MKVYKIWCEYDLDSDHIIFKSEKSLQDYYNQNREKWGLGDEGEDFLSLESEGLIGSTTLSFWEEE